jgi:hypothetical protein
MNSIESTKNNDKKSNDNNNNNKKSNNNNNNNKKSNDNNKKSNDNNNNKKSKLLNRLDFIEVDCDCYYVGYTQDGIPHGMGMFVFGDDKTHIGVYNMGMLDGFAIIDFENNDKYRGLVKNDKFNGLGYMFNSKNNGYYLG